MLFSSRLKRELLSTYIASEIQNLWLRIFWVDFRRSRGRQCPHYNSSALMSVCCVASPSHWWLRFLSCATVKDQLRTVNHSPVLDPGTDYGDMQSLTPVPRAPAPLQLSHTVEIHRHADRLELRQHNGNSNWLRQWGPGEFLPVQVTKAAAFTGFRNCILS